MRTGCSHCVNRDTVNSVNGAYILEAGDLCLVWDLTQEAQLSSQTQASLAIKMLQGIPIGLQSPLQKSVSLLQVLCYIAALCSVSSNSGHLKWTRWWHLTGKLPSSTSSVLDGWLLQGDPWHERRFTSPHPMYKAIRHSQYSVVNILYPVHI